MGSVLATGGQGQGLGLRVWDFGLGAKHLMLNLVTALHWEPGAQGPREASGF
jgi:hypothetical protein